MARTNEQLVRWAFTEATPIAAAQGRTLGSHELELAYEYVREGWSLVKSGDYDPETYARDDAERAIIAYVKNKLLLAPAFGGEFRVLQKRWAQQAAIAAWKEAQEEDE